MQLVIVGSDGPETARLQKLIRLLSLDSHVMLVSSLTDAELSTLYRHCELYVATSSMEGFGLPVVEALQCGARVVCSDIPVFREIAGTAPWYFNLAAASPVASLVGAMLMAVSEPARVPSSLHRFSSSEVAAQYLSLYSGLLTRRSSTEASNQSLSDDQALSYDRFAS
jgi:glycosyltransferase involved in cell wall biosynthesis